MNELLSLWLPILVSSIAVFFASFLAWMVIGHHKPDWQEMPNEKLACEHLRNSGLKPGRYMFPMCQTPEQMKDPVKMELQKTGPWGTINLWPAAPNMGRNLILTFSFYALTSVFVAYLGTLSLEPGAGFSPVFQVTGTAAILAYCFGFIPNAIWFGTPLRAVLMDLADGLAFGLITGCIFGLMWP